MNITTPSGVTLELRARQRAWQGVAVAACAIGVALAILVALCCRLAGCASRPRPVDAIALYQAHWQAGIYGDELADQEEEGRHEF